MDKTVGIISYNRYCVRITKRIMITTGVYESQSKKLHFFSGEK